MEKSLHNVSTNSASHDSDGVRSSTIMSPFAGDNPFAHRTPRSRCVRVGSAAESEVSTASPAANSLSNTNSLGKPLTLQATLPCSSPRCSSPFNDVSFVGTPSLLLPPSHSLCERNAASPCLPHSQLLTDEEVLLHELATVKTPQTPTVVLLSDPPTNWEPRGAALKPKKPASFFHVSQGNHSRGPPCTQSLISSGGGVGNNTSNSTNANNNNNSPGVGGHPLSPTQPGSTCGRAAGEIAAVSPGVSPSSPVATSTSNGKLANDPARRLVSPTATTSLFPTTEWIRAVLSNASAGRNANGDREKKSSATAGVAGVNQGKNEEATRSTTTTTAAAAAVAALTAAMVTTSSGVNPPPPRDTAMCLHERRVKAALRSQDEMREFSGILRRLEEEGSQVLRERRRKRREWRARQGGSVASIGPRRWSRNARITATPNSAGGEENASEDFSDANDADEAGDDNAVKDLLFGPIKQELTGKGLAGGGGGRCSFKAMAEVEGAEKMSRAALYKLRDRTAREWVRLQRQRLEQRREGQAALHRHLQESNARLQATRTRGGRSSTLDNAPRRQQKCLFPKDAESEPFPDTNLTLNSATGAALAISWGEANLFSTVDGVDATEAKETNEKTNAVELHPDSDFSIASDDVCAAEDQDLPLLPQLNDHDDSAPLVPVKDEHQSATGPSADPAMLLSSLTEKAKTSGVSMVAAHSSVTSQDGEGTDICRVESATITATNKIPTNAPPSDAQLRHELQRLLFQANEFTLYGLDQCLNSKAKTRSTTKQRQQGATRATPAATMSSTISNNNSSLWRNSPLPPQPLSSLRTADASGPTLPIPLHGTLGTYGEQKTDKPCSTSASHIEAGEASQLSQMSFAEANGGDRGTVLTPATTPLLPPLQTPLSTSLPFPLRRQLAHGPRAKPDARLGSSGQSGTSLPLTSASQQAVDRASVEKKSSTAAAVPPPPRRFTGFRSRKRHQRTPLPVRRGVGEHAAALLQHEILLTRCYEVEAERGNAREIDCACETLQKLLPLREQLLDQDIQRGNTTSKTLRAASQPLLLCETSTPSAASTAAAAATSTDGSEKTPHGERSSVSPEAAVDRSYHPQAILQQHRQLLYDEAVRMEMSSRYAARNAYMDVLTQLAQRHVSSVSWPVVSSLLADAREQLRQEADSATLSYLSSNTVGREGHARPSPNTSPREKLQQLIVAHLGVLELSQWPVQEVLQHLAALYRVPLYLLHEGIAEQQRRFAHTYNYEERFREVDRTVLNSGGSADCVLRLTLHRCRRPPVIPTRGGDNISNGNASACSGSSAAHCISTAATATPAATASSLSVPGKPLYFIRLRVGQQSVSSSAVPLTSAATGRAAGVGETSPLDDVGYATPLNGGAGDVQSSLSSSSTAKMLSFLGQTLTIYLPVAESAARRHLPGMGPGIRTCKYGYSQITTTATTATATAASAAAKSTNSINGESEEDGDGCVLTVEMMQTGVEAPLARGEVDLAAMGFNTFGEKGRVHAQTMSIPLRRKGCRAADLKVTLEVTL